MVPILNISIWLIVKVLFLVGLLIYLIFSAVVWRQVNLMTETLEISFEGVVRLLAALLFLLSLGVFILAIVIL